MPYEVQLRTENRWLTDCLFPEEREAVAYAQVKLESNQHEAVRVIEERHGRGGFVHERVVFEEARLGVGQRVIKASPLDEATFCTRLEEVYSLPARRTIGRVLRQYLDHVGLTPLELLVSAGQLRQLSRRDDLLNQAISVVAGLQARVSGEKTSERIDALYRLMAAVEAELEDPKELLRLEQEVRVEGTRGLFRMLRDTADPGRWNLLGLAAIGLLLGDSAEPAGKVALLIDQLERGADGDGIALIDDVLAELFDNLETIRALLGRRGDLAAAARVVVRLSVGEYRGVRGEDPMLGRVNDVIAAHEMPKTRGALHDWLDRAIRSTQPLTKEGPDADRQAFTQLLGDLVADEGLTGGARVTEAMTQRARSVLTSPNEEQRVDLAVDRMVRLIAPPGAKLGYLLDLTETPTGARTPESVLRHMAAVVRDVPDLNALSGKRGSAAELAGERFRLRMAEADLPDELRLTLSKRLEKLKPAGAPKAKGGYDPGKAADAASRDASLSQVFLQPGETLFNEGEPGDRAYLLRSGRMAILCDVEGEEVEIAVVERGAIVGEMALIDDQPRMATARALEACEMTVIPADMFKRRLKRLEDSDPVMRRLLDVFVDRIRVMTHRHLKR